MTRGAGPPEEARRVAAARLGPLARADVPLGPFCTYRVGGPAALFVEVRSIAVLEVVGEAVRASGLPVLVVGRGSNLLVADAGFPGIALHLSEAFAGLHVAGAGVTAGGAALLPVVARRTVAAGLSGFEWAVGVPGSVGGAVRMNAGGHGSDLAASLVEAEIHDLASGTTETWPAGRLQPGYRRSAVTAHQLVLSARLQLAEGDRERAAAEIADVVRWRRTHQPGGQNAGSVFANPHGDSAGRLIDAAGLKGLRLGSAEVATRHANFIQADPGGSADDVAALMRRVQAEVRDRFGVLLRPENHLVGFADDARPVAGEERA